MGFNAHAFWEIIHGIGLGVPFCISFAVVLYRLRQLRPESRSELESHARWLNVGAWGMAIAAWLMTITGTYIVYPAYRVELHPADWYSLGVEWMEHVAWFAPIFATVVGYLVYQYGIQLSEEPKIRQAAITLCVMAFLAALIAGACGEFLVRVALTH